MHGENQMKESSVSYQRLDDKNAIIRLVIAFYGLIPLIGKS